MKKGVIAAVMSYVIWGILPLYWKLLGQVDSMYVLASRIIWSLAFCFAVVAVSKKGKEFKAVIKNKKKLVFTALAGVFITINWGTYIWAVSHDRILDSSLGYYINPLMVVMAGQIFFKEKLSTTETVAIIIAAAGVVYMVVSAGTLPVISIVLSVSFAIYGALKKKAGLDSKVSLAWETVVVSPFALAFIILSEAGGNGAVGVLCGWEYILLPLAGVVTAMPLLLYGYSVKELPLSVVGITQYISPTLSLILGVSLYHEEFTVTHAVTFILIWTAVIVFVVGDLIKIRSKKKCQ